MEFMLESDADTFVSVYAGDFFGEPSWPNGRFPFLCDACKPTKIGNSHKQIGELR